MSFTFDILNPGPTSLLNNECGTHCDGSRNLSDLLDNLVLSEVLLSS